MSRVLVTGAGGRVGRMLVPALLRADFEVVAAARADLDVTQGAAVAAAVRDTGARAVINCAAFTGVDAAETEAARAELVNVTAVRHLAAACASGGIPLIHLSTDYVVNTRLGRPHTERDRTHAEGVYARTKLQAEGVLARSECRSLCVRTGQLFGPFGGSFVRAIVTRAREREVLEVTRDQEVTPTPVRALADALAQLTACMLRPGFDAWGLYHYCGAPGCNRAELARAILRRARACGALAHDCEVREVRSDQYPAPCPRPPDSRLDPSLIAATFGIAIPRWEDYLDETVAAVAAEAGAGDVAGAGR